VKKKGVKKCSGNRRKGGVRQKGGEKKIAKKRGRFKGG